MKAVFTHGTALGGGDPLLTTCVVQAALWEAKVLVVKGTDRGA